MNPTMRTTSDHQPHQRELTMHAIVVIPTYNERENLPTLIDRIHQAAPELHVLIVDDNSPDGTGALADRIAADHPDSVFTLHRERKAGLGTAYVEGFRFALARGYEVIMQMDADLSHDPAFLPQFLARIEHADLVLGSRYVDGINVVGWGFKRLLLSKFASIYVRVVTGMPVTDATGGFKCWRRRALTEIDLDAAFSNGYLFQIETTFKAFCCGCNIAEHPIIFYERKLGRSKLDWHVITEAVWGVVRLRLQSALRRSWVGKRPHPALRSTGN
jgi:dolichol-phosphate mannosyltransferase